MQPSAGPIARHLSHNNEEGIIVKKSFAPFVLGLGLLGAVSTARADGDWYAAVDAGNSWIGVYTSSYGDNTDHGYRLAGGYDIDRHFSLEAGYVDFGKVAADFCFTTVCIKGDRT